jgi:hypothetical protein
MNANVLMMLGYAHDGYLMARTSHSPGDEDEMMSTTSGAAGSAADDEAKADDLHWVHGRVQPGTKESCSRSRN